MEPEIFSNDVGTDAQERFQRWQADHPGGLYINLKASAHGMLHRVGCGHVGKAGEWDPRFGDLARRDKVCHTDRAVLLEWARREGVTVTPCADCQR